MKKSVIILMFFQIFYISAFSQLSPHENNTIDKNELQFQLDELRKLFNVLSIQLEQTQTSIEKGKTDVNTKVENIDKEIEAKFNGINSRTDNIEGKLKITDKEKEEFQLLSVSRNQIIEDNFAHFIKFYSDKYNQLDEKLTSEELAIEFRKIINPQSGSLGFKLSDKLQNILSANYNLLADKILKDGSKKVETKLKITDMLTVITSVLENPIVNDVTSIIPFASTIKSIVGTTSGLVYSNIDQKELKNEYRSTLMLEIKNSQDQIFNELSQIIAFYDHMAKLDNEYLMRLQNIRTDVGILGIELREFCLSLEPTLKKIDPSFSVNSSLSTREIAIHISNKIENLKNSTELNNKHLTIISNMTFEMKISSRELYNRYRETQELKIIANDKFVSDFNKIIREYSIAKSPDVVALKLSEKNKELIAKMKTNHSIDKSEFEKYLNKIYEL